LTAALLLVEQGFSFYAAAEDVIGAPKGAPVVILGGSANVIPRVDLSPNLDLPAVGLPGSQVALPAEIPQAQVIVPQEVATPLATPPSVIPTPSAEDAITAPQAGVAAETQNLAQTVASEQKSGDIASFSGHFFDGTQRASAGGVTAETWWKDPAVTHAAVTVPIFSLRRADGDPGIGKFTDLGRYYRDVLSKQGVDTVLLLPHFAVIEQSPYAPVSLYALNEDNVDWAVVPEVAGDKALSSRLKPGPSEGQEVDYVAVRAREEAVAGAAYQRFQSEQLDKNTPRAQAYRSFVKTSGAWLTDYAEYMALAKVIGLPSIEWTPEEIQAARQDPNFGRYVEQHTFNQWNAYAQMHDALKTIHDAGGKALFDIPMFRGKNGVDAWKNPGLFTDLKTRNPGIKNQFVNENWMDLALWNWTALKKNGYRDALNPYSHWLDFGFDGGRVDALHFAYRFGNGQLASGDEPGDDYVKALGDVFKAHGAMPLAEAFEGKDSNAQKLGFLTVYGDWKKVSTHDDPRQLGFPWRYFDAANSPSSDRNGKFIGYTLGDEWGDSVPIKEVHDGRSFWTYRIPLPSDANYSTRARYDARAQLRSLKSLKEGNVWKDAEAVGTVLTEAADSFVKHAGGSTQIWAASMDWFLEEWGRDTFVSLPGLLISTGRYEEAKQVMRHFSQYEKDGLIPNKINDGSVDYNTVDGSLWFIQAVKKYEAATGDKAFAKEMAPVMGRIVSHYQSGTGYERYGRFNKIGMDTDGLIFSPAQATWMDADPEGRDRPVTPRNGKAVEINALWYASLRYLAEVEREQGDAASAQAHGALADKVQSSFKTRFYFETPDNQKAWGGTGGALRDVVDGDIHSGAIRPNMLFAVSHGGDLLSSEQQKAVVLAAVKDLLTPYGLRTLSYRDSQYQGRYDTSQPPLVKDQAYHQGTVWPWLMGTFLDALARVRQSQGWDGGAIRAEAQGLLTPLVEFLVGHPQGSLPEVFDGGGPDGAMMGVSLDDPKGLGEVFAGRWSVQNPGGTRSQAWSVAEVLRALTDRGILNKGR
jgi:glycogen debranching enzyme